MEETVQEEGQAERGRGGTRWRRFAAIMVPTAIAVVGLGAAVANGAVPVSVSISGTDYRVTADQLSGTGYEQYGNLAFDGKGTPTPVVETKIADAYLVNMCQEIDATVPVFNIPVSMALRAGANSADDKTKQVHATDLVIDMTNLAATSATFQNIAIGEDAHTLLGSSGDPLSLEYGQVAQTADSLTINGVDQKAYLTTAATFTLPGLSLDLGGTCS